MYESTCPEGADARLLRLLMKYGSDFEVQRNADREIGAPRQCYGNAFDLSADDAYLYAEGFVRSSDQPPLHHAWCLNSTGRVIDPTLPNAEAFTYFGIAFTHEVVNRIMVREIGFIGPILHWISDDRSREANIEFSTYQR